MIACSSPDGICSVSRACRARKLRIAWRARCALLSQKFVSHELPPRDEAARDLRFLPPFMSVAPEHLTAAADRVLAGKYSFFDLTDCELGIRRNGIATR